MRFKPVSDAQSVDTLRHPGDEGVVDPLLDQETVGGDADLAAEAELCRHGSVDSAVEVGVVKNLFVQARKGEKGMGEMIFTRTLYGSTEMEPLDCTYSSTSVSPITYVQWVSVRRPQKA